MNTFTRAALTILVGLAIWFLPHTEAIKPEGWHLLAIFTATIRLYLTSLANGHYGAFWYCCSRSN